MAEWKSASWKQEEDHSAEAAAVIEKINATTVPVLLLSSSEPLEEHLDVVLAVEKKARFGGDTLSTQKCAVEVIKILRDLGKLDQMMATCDSLMKKRGQMKQVQAAMLNAAAEALTARNLDRADKMGLLQQLKHQAEGRIHVELEHARYTMELAHMLIEAQPGQSADSLLGNKRQASDMLGQVQVETITNMPRLEKIESVLMQIELSLELDDGQRTQTLSRKMNPRALGKADTKAHKVRYWKLMATHFERRKEFLVMARCWHEIFLTLPAPEDAPAAADADDDGPAFGGTTRAEALSNAIVLALLAGHATTKEIEDVAECAAFSKESLQTDRTKWLEALAASRDVENECPDLHRFLKQVIDVEMLRAALASTVDELARTHPMLAGSDERRTGFHERLSEHDVMVAAKFYKRIRLTRLAQLVGLSDEATEQFIMKLVASKSIYAKVDRIDGVVVFERQANPIDVAKRWNERVDTMGTLVDRTCHLVAKERMLIAVGGAPAAAA